MLRVVSTQSRPAPEADRLLVARLQGAAKRYGGWDEPVGQERQVALQDLRDIGGDNTDAYAQAAGIMLGCHPEGDASHERYRVAAQMLLDAADISLDDPRVQQWVTVGEERRNQTQAWRQAGDTFAEFGARRHPTKERPA